MYNVFKGQVVPTDDDSTKIIDSNDRMQEALDRQREKIEERLAKYREEVINDYLATLTADDEGKPVIPRDEEGEYILPHDMEGNQLLFVTSDGFLSEEEEIIPEEPEEEFTQLEDLEVVEPEEPQLPPIDREAILDEVNAEADSIREAARAEANGILESARTEAEALRAEASEAGRQEGFSNGHAEGLSKASEECELKLSQQTASLQAEVNAQIAGLEAEKQQLEEDYRAKQNDLEKQMADVFCDIIDKVFAIEFSGKKDIILHLVDNVIANTPTSKEYIIRVNDCNYETIIENRQMLIDKIGEGVELEVVKDPLLTPDECQIETDGGVYDCGMDVELSNLLKDLRALSLV